MVPRKIGLVVLVAAALAMSSLAAASQDGVPGNPTRGKALFVRPGLFCSSCHTLKAAKSHGRSGPNLDVTKPSYAAIVRSVADGGKASKRWPTGMPAYSGPHAEISKAQIDDIAAFVYTATH